MRRVPREMSALSLAYNLVVRFRRSPKGMSVVRFSLAKAGQPLVARFRRALRGMSALPEACSFYAFEKSRRPTFANPSTRLTRGISVLRFCLANAGQPLMPDFDKRLRPCPLCVLERQGRKAVGEPRSTRLKRDVRRALKPCKGRQSVGRQCSTRTQGCPLCAFALSRLACRWWTTFDPR